MSGEDPPVPRLTAASTLRPGEVRTGEAPHATPSRTVSPQENPASDSPKLGYFGRSGRCAEPGCGGAAGRDAGLVQALRMHALLTPGTYVLRRSRTQLQVGLDPERALHLDVPADGAIDGGTALTSIPRSALPALVREGLAAPDDRALREALPPLRAETTWERHTLSALFRAEPDRMVEAVARRRAVRVTVTSFGHPLAETMARDLEHLCRRSGLCMAADRAPGPPKADAPPADPVHALVGVGEPPRDLVDRLVRDAVPHVLARMVEGAAVIGPFVEPGATACLRCLDTHQAGEDPAWPLLVEQYARATRRDRPDGVPEPVDAALAALAVAWTARDLATHASGGHPVTRTTTVRLSPGLETIETRRWPPHPRCGCAWTVDVPPGPPQARVQPPP